MRTVIRNSYTPQTGDYCNKIVVDQDKGVQYIFDSDGVWTTYTSKQQEGAPLFYVDSAVNGAKNEMKTYTDTQDAAILAQAKAYTDEHGGSGEDELFYINVTNVDYTAETFTADKTYAEILEAYNAGKLPVVIAKEEGSNYRHDGVYVLRSYNVSDEGNWFGFVDVHANGGEGRVTADSRAILIGDGFNFATSSYGGVVIDDTLSQSSNHAISNSAVYAALSQKADQGDIPTVNNATLTIQRNGTTVQTFTANQSTNATANITVPNITLQTTDPGEGSALAANNFIGVYS